VVVKLASVRAIQEGRQAMRFVTNHWGWSWRGIRQWLASWAWPVDVWGVEVSGSNPRRFTRRVKVGPVCFAWGEYPASRR
jgi:hypothetical protein